MNNNTFNIATTVKFPHLAVQINHVFNMVYISYMITDGHIIKAKQHFRYCSGLKFFSSDVIDAILEDGINAIDFTPVLKCHGHIRGYNATYRLVDMISRELAELGRWYGLQINNLESTIPFDQQLYDQLLQMTAMDIC